MRNIVTMRSVGLYAAGMIFYTMPALAMEKNAVISEATGKKFTQEKGTYFDESCAEDIAYSNEVLDLNDDGVPEVFTTIEGTCFGGATGSFIELYIKDKANQWQPQFGFPGIYNVLKERNLGYPDIEIGGPGFCFPIWRWNGVKYDIHKKCPN